jgi:hypothetical protein
VGEATNTATESASECLQTSMNIIKRDHKNLRLRVANYFVEVEYVNQAPEHGVEYTKQIDIGYIFNVVRKGFKVF